MNYLLATIGFYAFVMTLLAFSIGIEKSGDAAGTIMVIIAAPIAFMKFIRERSLRQRNTTESKDQQS